MSESLVIDFLYKSRLGRFFLKGLINPTVSKKTARFLSSPASRYMIKGFIKKNDIKIEQYEIPDSGFKSFNDFFTRKIKAGKREIERADLISPCDGLLTVSNINENSIFNIKNTSYNLEQLLKDKKLAQDFREGMAFIFRLTPAHYHRYVFPADGVIVSSKKIKGVLHSVKPVCHNSFPVFIQNSREYILFANEKIGPYIQMEVGALLVGKISNKIFQEGDTVKKGQEKGFFEYGGSSIVILLKNRYELCSTIQSRKSVNGEIAVNLGESLIYF